MQHLPGCCFHEIIVHILHRLIQICTLFNILRGLMAASIKRQLCEEWCRWFPWWCRASWECPSTASPVTRTRGCSPHSGTALRRRGSQSRPWWSLEKTALHECDLATRNKTHLRLMTTRNEVSLSIQLFRSVRTEQVTVLELEEKRGGRH